MHRPRHLLALSTLLLLTSCASKPEWKPLEDTRETSTLKLRPSTSWRTIGHSVEDRPIQAATTGYGAFRLLIIAGIHGSEREGLEAPDPLLSALAEPALARLARVMIVRDLNPDGSINRTRRNANGVDLNRNWPASNFRPGRDHGPSPLSEPETASLASEMQRFTPDLVIIFHSAGSGPFVDSDGPGEPDAAAFVNAAQTIDPRWRQRPDFTNPHGSLGSYLGLDQNRPILTIEFRKGQDRDLATRAAIAGIRAIIEQRR